jgi:hypothetical protein
MNKHRVRVVTNAFGRAIRVRVTPLKLIN